jgi:hypothetical protein
MITDLIIGFLAMGFFVMAFFLGLLIIQATR